MCQISVYIKREDGEELLQENVTRMHFHDSGIRVNSLFEGASEMKGIVLDHIDFSTGKVVVIEEPQGELP